MLFLGLGFAGTGFAQNGTPRTFSVLTYGARGDGQTDNQSAITSAITAAEVAGGGTIYFPAGVYLHSNLLVFGSNLTVQGVGSQSVVQATNPQLASLQFLNATNCAVEDLKIVGTGSTRLTWDSSSGILLMNSSLCAISGVTINGGSSVGIMVSNTTNTQILGNTISNTLADGVHVVDGSQGIMVSGNYATNTGDDSFAAVAYGSQPQTSNVTFRDNTSVSSHTRGVTCIGAANCTISGNLVTNPVGHGIAVAYEAAYQTWTPSNATVSGNLVRGTSSVYNSILVDGAQTVTLSNNTITNSTQLYVLSSRNVTVSGTQMANITGPAMVIQSSSNVSVLSSTIVNTAGTAIYCYGVTTGQISSNSMTTVAQQSLTAAIWIEGSYGISGAANTLTASGSVPPFWQDTSAQVSVSVTQH